MRTDTYININSSEKKSYEYFQIETENQMLMDSLYMQPLMNEM